MIISWRECHSKIEVKVRMKRKKERKKNKWHIRWNPIDEKFRKYTHFFFPLSLVAENQIWLLINNNLFLISLWNTNPLRKYYLFFFVENQTNTSPEGTEGTLDFSFFTRLSPCMCMFSFSLNSNAEFRRRIRSFSLCLLDGSQWIFVRRFQWLFQRFDILDYNNDGRGLQEFLSRISMRIYLRFSIIFLNRILSQWIWKRI